MGQREKKSIILRPTIKIENFPSFQWYFSHLLFTNLILNYRNPLFPESWSHLSCVLPVLQMISLRLSVMETSKKKNRKNSIDTTAEWQWDGGVFISLYLAAPALGVSSVSKGPGIANSPGKEQQRAQRWQEGGEPIHAKTQLITDGNGLRLCTVGDTGWQHLTSVWLTRMEQAALKHIPGQQKWGVPAGAPARCQQGCPLLTLFNAVIEPGDLGLLFFFFFPVDWVCPRAMIKCVSWTLHKESQGVLKYFVGMMGRSYLSAPLISNEVVNNKKLGVSKQPHPTRQIMFYLPNTFPVA